VQERKGLSNRWAKGDVGLSSACWWELLTSTRARDTHNSYTLRAGARAWLLNFERTYRDSHVHLTRGRESVGNPCAARVHSQRRTPVRAG